MLGCGGPRELDGGVCPMVTEGHCALIEGADAVVNGLGLRDPAHREVLATVRSGSDVPVLVELPSPQRARLEADFPGCAPIPFPVRPQDLVRAVDAVVQADLTGA